MGNFCDRVGERFRKRTKSKTASSDSLGDRSKKTIRCISRIWSYVTDLSTALKPMRFGILGVLLAIAAFTENATGQGRDVLRIYDGIGFGEHLWWVMYIGLAVFGIVTWYEARRATRLRFKVPRPGWATAPDGHKDDRMWTEREYMEAYRIHFPPTGYTPEALDTTDLARRRVKWIIGWRKWLPRCLGAAAVWSMTLGYAMLGLLNAHFDQTLILGGVLILLFMFRRDIQRFLGRTKTDDVYVRDEIPDAASDADIEYVDEWSRVSCGWRCAAYFAIFLLFTAWIWCFIDPGSAGRSLGAIGVFLLIVSLIVVVGTWLARANRRSNLPIFSAVVVLLVFIHMGLGEHYLRSSDTSIEKERPMLAAEVDKKIRSLAKKFNLAETGATGQPASDAAHTAAEKGPVIPLIFVATAGGGSRAAYWTGTILGRLQDRTVIAKADFPLSSHLVAMSGVSGGSLGAGMFVSLLRHPNVGPQENGAPSKKTFETAIQQAIEPDFLGPTLAAMFSRDLIPGSWKNDRSAAIEFAWEEAWRHAVCNEDPKCKNHMATPFTKLFEKHPLPALFLNGTVAETGSRVITSNLDYGNCKPPDYGQKVKRFEEACKVRFVNAGDLFAIRESAQKGPLSGDINLSTAITTSARFPIVLPAARIKLANPDKDKKGQGRIVDGGYFENFGAITLMEVLQVIKPLLKDYQQIKPVIIQISSDPDLNTDRDDERASVMSGPDSNPLTVLAQLRSPLRGALSTRAAHGIRARLALQQMAKTNEWGYFHFSMGEHRGSAGKKIKTEGDGPSLGWFLSEQAKAEIEGLLDPSIPGSKNASQFEKLEACLTNGNEDDCKNARKKPGKDKKP